MRAEIAKRKGEFQSAPGFLAGRNRCSSFGIMAISRFNPLPAFWPGETCMAQLLHLCEQVSIRSRLFGREKRAVLAHHYPDVPFQSAPGFLAGRNSLRLTPLR